MAGEMLIRPVRSGDCAAIWSILAPTIRAGQTCAVDPALGEAEALEWWLGGDRRAFVAEENGTILGTYYLRANQLGGGDHVANCGYMTAPDAMGRGVARAMCADSLERARELGFRAMQFNLVVTTNLRAVALWQGMGFAVAGRLPGAFRHPVEGFVDALVMFREL